jgi:hypothetical protein
MLLEVVRYIWRTEKVEESWLVGKIRLLPKSGDLSNPNNWRGMALLAMIAKLFCSVLSNRMTSHMQVIGLEAQCGFMPGKNTVDAIFTMRVSLQKRFRFQKDTWVPQPASSSLGLLGSRWSGISQAGRVPRFI